MTGKVAWRILEKRNGTGAWAGQTAVRNARSLEKQGKAHYLCNEGSPGSGPLRKQWAGGGEAPVWADPIEGGWGAQAARWGGARAAVESCGWVGYRAMSVEQCAMSNEQ